MRTFSRYLLESPLDELPAAVEGQHPHETQNSYEEEKELSRQNPELGFQSLHIYHDPDNNVTTNIISNHLAPGWTGDPSAPKPIPKSGTRWQAGVIPSRNAGIADISTKVKGSFNDKSEYKFHMPSEVMGMIKSSASHVHDFITKQTPLGLHTITYRTTDPKRHALYQHLARLYPHITFKNTDEVAGVKRKPKKSLTDSVDTNYWNMSNINKFILESPIDELPAAVEGVHPHETENTYEEEKDSVTRDENWPPQADKGFTSTHIYQDPDSGIKTHIEMDHVTPGWEERKDRNQGVARCEVRGNGMFGDSSKTRSRFHMPGEIMGKIASSSSHLHDFITKYKPHTVEYSTTDPKRHALYQHMGRHLYPHIWFNNIREVEPVERKPKKSLTDSVDTNYWNMSNINKFILESPIDELPVAVEGVHPHQTWDNYKTKKKAAGHWMKVAGHEAPTGFKTNHVYHDPHSGVATDIHMIHGTPGWGGDPHPSVGVAHVSVSVGGQWGDASQTGSGFQMPGDIMGKIKVSREHIHDFITKYTPHGLHTIEYDTDDPKRHALYQHIATQYPHILFRNTGELKPVERKPKKAVGVSESYTQKQMRVANQTSRNSGAIGKKAITPAYVKTITGKKHKILDFGSGRDAAHTKALRKTGRQVTAHEFGANVNKNHNPKALKKKYDTVFASNVLNTASSRKMLSDTLDQMHSAVAPGGALVANLPLSPRKSVKVDAKHLMRQLLKRFGDVRRVGGTKKAPLFHATGPK